MQYVKLKAFYKKVLPALTEEGWELCASVLTVRKLRKGELLLAEGSVCRHISFVNHGLLRMYYQVDGKEKIVMFCNELNYISDYRSFLLQEPALTYIQALEDTELLCTGFEALQMLYRMVPEANQLGRLIAEELFIDMCRRTGADVNDTIDRRYEELLREKPWLAQRVPQYMIAAHLGITPEALSRIRARATRKSKLPVATY